MSLSSLVRRRADLLAYIPLSVATTVADVLGRDRTHAATKVLLAPALAGGVLATREDRCPKRNGTLLVALTGSVVGDWYMYRASRSEGDVSRGFMRRGASAFGVQQAGLIGLLAHDGARPRPAPSAAVATTLAGLAVLDSDGGGPPDPVLTGYGLLLGTMSALAMGDGGNPRTRPSVALGGALFLVSDAAIIVGQRFAGSPRAQALSSAVILSTYTAALGLLVRGLREEPAEG